jgi:hypothetical protein
MHACMMVVIYEDPVNKWLSTSVLLLLAIAFFLFSNPTSLLLLVSLL